MHKLFRHLAIILKIVYLNYSLNIHILTRKLHLESYSKDHLISVILVPEGKKVIFTSIYLDNLLTIYMNCILFGIGKVLPQYDMFTNQAILNVAFKFLG